MHAEFLFSTALYQKFSHCSHELLVLNFGSFTAVRLLSSAFVKAGPALVALLGLIECLFLAAQKLSLDVSLTVLF